jgi:hypothetical protein
LRDLPCEHDWTFSIGRDEITGGTS